MGGGRECYRGIMQRRTEKRKRNMWSVCVCVLIETRWIHEEKVPTFTSATRGVLVFIKSGNAALQKEQKDKANRKSNKEANYCGHW